MPDDPVQPPAPAAPVPGAASTSDAPHNHAAPQLVAPHPNAGHAIRDPLRTARHALRDYWNRVLDSPTWRAVFFLLSTVFSGVLSGAFIAEITINGKLVWRGFYTAASFWALGGLSVLLYAYQRALLHREGHVSRFSDKEYCLAYMRAQCLPEAAQRYKELIRKGDGGEFEKAMAELRRTLR